MNDPLPSVLLACALLVGCAPTDSEASAPRSGEQLREADANRPVPRARGLVTDLAQALSEEREATIATSLAEYEQEMSHEFAVLTVESLHGEAIESFSLRVARSWGMGKVDVNNGLLIVLALQDRKTRIEVGDGLRGRIPDGLAQEIITSEMLPAFEAGRYADGLEAGLEALMAAAR
jgi:uncharacterized protein